MSENAERDKSTCSHLLNRYQLLHMTSGILSSEPLYQAELSDFMGVNMNDNQRDIHPMFIMVNRNCNRQDQSWENVVWPCHQIQGICVSASLLHRCASVLSPIPHIFVW
jgi:hypothetical protein